MYTNAPFRETGDPAGSPQQVFVVDRLEDTYKWYRGGFGAYAVPVRAIHLDWHGRLSPTVESYHDDGEWYCCSRWSRSDGSVDTWDDELIRSGIARCFTAPDAVELFHIK